MVLFVPGIGCETGREYFKNVSILLAGTFPSLEMNLRFHIDSWSRKLSTDDMFHYLQILFILHVYLFRYQIIGYQIISGHIVHNTEHDNREREQDSQSGAEGEEASEQSGTEDTTREMSGTVKPLLEGYLCVASAL